MKKQTYKWVIITLILASFGIWSYVVQATEQVTGKNVVVGQTQAVEDDLILAGEQVQVQCEAKQDLIAAGSDVTISGPVKGYIIAAGSNIRLNGPVGNDLFAAGVKLYLNAPVADNAMLAGGEIYVQPGAEIQHDAILAGGTIDVAGKVARDLKLAAGEAQLASEVGGSVLARVGQLKLLPTAVVRGDLKVYSPKPPEISSQAQILGSIEHIKIEEQRGIVSWLNRWLYSFLALSFVGLLAIWLMPWWTNRVTAKFTNKTGTTLLIGLAGLFLIPLAAFLLCLTIVGIPLAFIALALYVVALLLSGVFAAWFAGGWLCNQFWKSPVAPWLRMLTGTLAVSLLVALPLIGVLVGLLIMLAGLGALLLERQAMWQQLHTEQGIAMG